MQKSADERFEELVDIFGRDLASFMMCAVYDIAYDIEKPIKNWTTYTAKEVRSFSQGDTDIDSAINASMSDIDRWAVTWGLGDEDNPYTDDDYRKLDRIFATYSSRSDRVGGLDAQGEYTLRSVSVMQLKQEKAIAKGDKDNVQIAEKLSKMIQESLAAEQMRKKDAKPIETARIDGIVEAVAKKWGVNVNLTYEEAIEACSKWLMSHKYPVTMDAAEHMLLAIINTTRGNNDLPDIEELPVISRFDPAQASEFSTEQNPWEKEVYKYLNITHSKDKGKNERWE